MTANTSENTARKMDAFRHIIKWHIRITDATRGSWLHNRWPFKQEYLYIDLYAGPGAYNRRSYTGYGSPMIAINELIQACMPHKAMLFNWDKQEADTLNALLAAYDNVRVYNTDNQNAPGYLECHSRQFGLAYFDPNNVRFDHELGAKITDCLPRVDLLFYLSASTEKRIRTALDQPIGEGYSLLEKMQGLNKKNWFVYAPYSKFQYTFLLGTNANPSDWQRQHWYSVNSAKGITVLNVLNWTKRELTSKKAIQMGFDL